MPKKPPPSPSPEPDLVGDEIVVDHRFIQCKSIGEFDVKIPILHVAGVKNNTSGIIEIETAGGDKYTVSLDEVEAEERMKAIEKVLYG